MVEKRQEVVLLPLKLPSAKNKALIIDSAEINQALRTMIFDCPLSVVVLGGGSFGWQL